MSFIEETTLENAAGRLREIYEEGLKSAGYIENTDRVLSLRPDVIDAWGTLIKTIRSHMRLRRYELVTLAAAQALECRYCMLAHGAVLHKNFFSAEEVVAILEDRHRAGLEGVEVALMDFAVKITKGNDPITREDIQTLRENGLDDGEITDVVLAVSARNFFSKVLNSLGAEPDAAFQETQPELWQHIMGSE